MLQRFDHAVIGVPDLEEAMTCYQRLGFEVSEGGRHPSLGTRNAIVRFGLDYLELLSVEDPEQARSRGPFGAELLAFLQRGPGLVGYVLAGVDLGEQAEGFQRLDIATDGPFEMDRIRPDGRRLRWRLVVPGGSPWRKPWPYLIDWITPQTDLLAWDPPGVHDCGATRVAGLDLVVGDLAEATHIYDHALGLRSHRVSAPGVEGGDQTRSYHLAGCHLRLIPPTAYSSMSAELAGNGPGPYRLVVAVADVGAAAGVLTRRGVQFDDHPQGLDINPHQACGVRIRVSPA